MVLGHDINATKRTQDIRTNQDVLFDALLLSERTLQGLNKAGFYKPSPVQLHGIPMGKCGFDLLLEAKSGTGKTIVFTVIALEKLDLRKELQAIMLAPTREIASQICDVIKEVGMLYSDLCVEVVMGGLPLQDDIKKFKIGRKVHIVVGSPGRLRHLIQGGYIDTSAVRLLVLDEADKLIEKTFQADINFIFSSLPNQKQVVMSSATFSDTAKEFISQYVREPQHICPDSTSVLLGIEQKVTLVNTNTNIVKQTYLRYQELMKILTSKDFKQCLIFCNYQTRVADVYKLLTRDKWPCEQLYGSQEQTDRLDALKTLQEYKCRILISTDLAARGIDASNVDLVINFEPPYEWQTYLHRIGRAGRYGSYGTAVSIVSVGKEEKKFKEILSIMQGSLNISYYWENKKYVLNSENGEAKEVNNGNLHEHKNGKSEKKINEETNIDKKEDNEISNGGNKVSDVDKDKEINVTTNGDVETNIDVKKSNEINPTNGGTKLSDQGIHNEIHVTTNDANNTKENNEINTSTNSATQINDLDKNSDINVTTHSVTNKSMFEYLWGQNNNDIKLELENFDDLAKSFNDSQSISNFDDLLESLENHDSSKDDVTQKLLKIQINDEEITNCINLLNISHKTQSLLTKTCTKDTRNDENTTELEPIVTNENVLESNNTIDNFKNLLCATNENENSKVKSSNSTQNANSDDESDDILDEQQSEMIRFGLPTSFCSKAEKHENKKRNPQKSPTKCISHVKIENNHPNIRKHVDSDNTSKKCITRTIRSERSNLFENNSEQFHNNADNIDRYNERRISEDTRKANDEFKHKKSLKWSSKPPEINKPHHQNLAQNNQRGGDNKKVKQNENRNKKSEKSKNVNEHKTNEDEYTLWYNALKLRTMQLEQIFYMEEMSQIKI